MDMKDRESAKDAAGPWSPDATGDGRSVEEAILVCMRAGRDLGLGQVCRIKTPVFIETSGRHPHGTSGNPGHLHPCHALCRRYDGVFHRSAGPEFEAIQDCCSVEKEISMVSRQRIMFVCIHN